MAESNKINKSFLVLSLIYCLAAVIIINIVYFYSKSNLDREVSRLQNEISTNSEIKAVGLRKWVLGKVESVNSVSENLSVKMYLSEDQTGSPLDERLAQEQFIKNYLVSEARKTGFSDTEAKDDIRANVSQDSSATLAVFDKSGKLIVSLGVPDNLDKIYKTIPTPGEVDGYFNIVFSEGNKDAYLLVLKAIKHFQSGENVGYVVGIRKLDSEFLSIADFPPDEGKFARTDIAFMDKDGLALLNSKLGDAYEKLANSKESESLAEVDAVLHTGNIVEKFSRKSVKVFSLAKDVYEGKLFVIYSVDEKGSLKPAKDFHRNLLVVSVLALVSLGLLMLLIWRHSSSLKYKRISAELNRQTSLLKLVTDHQLQSMFLLSEDNKIMFANKLFLNENNSTSEEAIDKPLANVVGTSLATTYIDIASVDAADPIVVTAEEENEDGSTTFLQRKCVPVVNNHDAGGISHLFVENDITPLMKERKKYENNLSNIIETIIRIIEQRSVYFYQHSQKLSALSLHVAESLKIDVKMKRAVEISAKLCNLYIALLPRDLINKQDKLSDNERRMFDEFPYKTIEIIKDLEFDAPVIQTLTQLVERPDGGGPAGLSDDDIIDSAKILKVVNDFIAMTSDRPYRRRMPATEAIDILLRQKDKKYSGKVIYALANYVENHAE